MSSIFGSAPEVTRKMVMRAIAGAVAAALVAVGGIEGSRYWTVGRFMETTDDAYVKADSTIVAPKVSGYIADVIVNDNQLVQKGQLLARIDDRDLRTAVDDAVANVAAATASVAHLDAQIAAQSSVIRQADASVTAAAAALSLSQRNDIRRQKMAEVGYGSVEQADNASTNAKEGRANLDRLQAAALTARQQVAIFNTPPPPPQAQLGNTQASNT